MAFAKFVIAGLKVSMDIRSDMMTSRSEKYLCDFSGEPDIVIPYREDRINALQKHYPKSTVNEFEYICTHVDFYTSIIKYKGFMLHSSAVSYGGKAYLFTADSGTGKSTHTSLWADNIKGAEILNDDKPAVRIIDGEAMAFGTPWSGKTEQNVNKGVKVGAVAVLKRGTVCSICEADGKTIALNLLRQTMNSPEEGGTELLLDTLNEFSGLVPIYDFAADISLTALKTSFEKMTGEKLPKEIKA